MMRTVPDVMPIGREAIRRAVVTIQAAIADTTARLPTRLALEMPIHAHESAAVVGTHGQIASVIDWPSV